MPDRIRGYLNGIEIQRDEEVATILAITYLDNENGNIIAEAEGPQIICWFAELDAGQHIFVVEVTKTSGEYSRVCLVFHIDRG